MEKICKNLQQKLVPSAFLIWEIGQNSQCVYKIFEKIDFMSLKIGTDVLTKGNNTKGKLVFSQP